MIITAIDSTHDKTSQNNTESITSSLEKSCSQENAHDDIAFVNRSNECVVKSSRQVILI